MKNPKPPNLKPKIDPTKAINRKLKLFGLHPKQPKAQTVNPTPCKKP